MSNNPKLHQLHLDSEPFARIRSGVKTLECRLLDQKRQAYRPGDRLRFTRRGDESDVIEATILRLYIERSFHDLFLNPAVQEKIGSDNVQKLVDDMTEYYSKEEQHTLGVIGIEFVVNGT